MGLVQPFFVSQEGGVISTFSIYSIYFLLLAPVVMSYFLMGPNIVVQADQQYYKINLGIQLITLLRSILVIVIAMMGFSLEVVLVADGILTIVSYVYSRNKALKLYPYLKDNKKEARDLSALKIQSMSLYIRFQVLSLIKYRSFVINLFYFSVNDQCI